MIWGFGNPGDTLTTSFNGKILHTTVGQDNVWRQKLGATPAGGPYSLSVSAPDSSTLGLSDVLFGDVFLCGGQSNMQFTVLSGFNASAEIAAAEAYPNIRVMTVGQGSTSYTPLPQLASIAFPWAPAGSALIGSGNWTSFSAVCWFFGRNVFEGLGGSVPIGLISNNWGGTRVQAWQPPSSLAACNSNHPSEASEWREGQVQVIQDTRRDIWAARWGVHHGDRAAAADAQKGGVRSHAHTRAGLRKGDRAADSQDHPHHVPMYGWSRHELGVTPEDLTPLSDRPSHHRMQNPPMPGASHTLAGGPGPNNASVLWNAMIVPFTVGPMALKGFTWYQAEANAGQPAVYQQCQVAMINTWRGAFGKPGLWFGLVLMEPWVTTADLAALRVAQLYAAQVLPNIAVGSAIDIGDPSK
jgi:hypothetical protein